MSSSDEPFFSWASRQVVVTRDIDPTQGSHMRGGHSRIASPRIALDCRLTVGHRAARLVSFGADDSEYMALIVGNVSGRKEIPIRAIDEEVLLIEGTRCQRNAEILVAIPADAESMFSCSAPQRVLERQLCTGGPIRDMVRSTGAVSVLVDWSVPSAPAA